jgi:DNA polymerase III subunit gamma/tau
VLSLARKYRPKNFRTVAVQTHVSNTLKGAIARGRVAPGYLLCGPRGVGKTTLARVLAMALNCERRIEAIRGGQLEAWEEESGGEPCGVCTSCQRIWSGGASLDVIEIDAASNRGVDDARELRERAMYAPSGEHRYKVYIVDEAHMLTREAWNALLKILEEPPPRVVFVFATTEPQKIAQAAAPILSRLQRFDFKRIGPADIRYRLGEVLSEEGIPGEPDALSMIARAADGSMRDALSLTDQVLAFGEGGVTAERVRDALGLVAEDEYLDLLDVIADHRAADVFPAVGRLVEMGVDLGLFLAGLGDILRAQLAVSLGAPATDVSDRAREALVARADAQAPADLLRMLNAIGELEPRFRRSGQQQLLLEALLVRFALLDRTVDLEDVLRALPGGGGAPPAPRPAEGARRSGGPGSAGRLARDSGASRAATSQPTVAADTMPRAGGSTPRASAADDAPRASAPRRDDDSAPSPGRSGGATARWRETPVAPSVAVEEAPAAPSMVRERQGAPSAVPLAQGSSAATAVAEPPRRQNGAPGPAHAAAGALPERRASTLDLNAVVGHWDDIIAAVRRERPMLGTLLGHVIPVGVAASGLLTLQGDDIGTFEALSAKARDLQGALEEHIAGLTRVQLRPPAPESAGPSRMTVESIRSDSLAWLRRQDPVIAAAIDELDLELID